MYTLDGIAYKIDSTLTTSIRNTPIGLSLAVFSLYSPKHAL